MLFDILQTQACKQSHTRTHRLVHVRVVLCVGPQLKAQIGAERSRALEELRASLEEEHGATLASSRAEWVQQREAEVLQQVQSQLAQEKAAWQDEHSKVPMAQ